MDKQGFTTQKERENETKCQNTGVIITLSLPVLHTAVTVQKVVSFAAQLEIAQ